MSVSYQLTTIDENSENIISYEDLKFHRDFRGIVYDSSILISEVNLLEKKMIQLLQRKKEIDLTLYNYLRQKGLYFVIFCEINFVVYLTGEKDKIEVFAYDFPIMKENELVNFITDYLKINKSYNHEIVLEKKYEIICN